MHNRGRVHPLFRTCGAVLLCTVYSHGAARDGGGSRRPVPQEAREHNNSIAHASHSCWHGDWPRCGSDVHALTAIVTSPGGDCECTQCHQRAGMYLATGHANTRTIMSMGTSTSTSTSSRLARTRRVALQLTGHVVHAPTCARQRVGAKFRCWAAALGSLGQPDALVCGPRMHASAGQAHSQRVACNQVVRVASRLCPWVVRPSTKSFAHSHACACSTCTHACKSKWRVRPCITRWHAH